ncbi:MmcQ/YjbR family DNA-binding protein [Alteromonadaceae bacterium M269]|nr:MmcQ/YjbR family DNA-binding protein [Alteromonadaceae bacterium M269]
MEFEALNQYLLAKPETIQDFPFGDDVYVYKVKKKMFALIGWREEKMMLNLKCDPDEAVALRDVFSAITEGYHMDKKHWISVYFDGTVPDGEVKRLIDNSFKLIVEKMPKKDQRSILLHL